MPQQGPCTGSEYPLQYCSYNLVQPNKYVKKFGGPRDPGIRPSPPSCWPCCREARAVASSFCNTLLHPGACPPADPLPSPGLCPHGCPSPYPGSLPGVVPWGVTPARGHGVAGWARQRPRDVSGAVGGPTGHPGLGQSGRGCAGSGHLVTARRDGSESDMALEVPPVLLV